MKYLATLVLLAIFSSQALTAPIPKQVSQDPTRSCGIGLGIFNDLEVCYMYSDDYYQTGLKIGDKVLTINGVKPQFSIISELTTYYRPGAILIFEVMRDNKKIQVPVKLKHTRDINSED